MPTIWAAQHEHLGRRKPEGALVLAEARSRNEIWRALVLELRQRVVAQFASHAQFLDLPYADVVMPGSHAASSAPREAVLAFVDPSLAGRAHLLALVLAPGASQDGDRAPPRICTSLAPDGVRAALAGLGDLSSTQAWTCSDDEARSRLADALGFQFSWGLPADEEASPTSPAALHVASLAGGDLERLEASLLSAIDALHPNDPLDGIAPFRLGALLSGLAQRGATNVLLAAPLELQPLARWIESAAAGLPGKSRFSIAVGELEAPEAYGPDRLIVELKLDAAPAGSTAPTRNPAQTGSAAPHDQAARSRRLIGAGLPVIQIAMPSLQAVAGELIRWELALAFASGRETFTRPGDAKVVTSTFLEPASRAAMSADAAPGLSASALVLGEPALRDEFLSLHAATPTHAYILRKVAGTLGKFAETSVHHWVAAQIAMGDPGEFVSLHWLALPTREARAGLLELQRGLRGPHNLAVRVSFAPPEFDAQGPLAGASSRGLFFLLSDGGGAELLANGAEAHVNGADAHFNGADAHVAKVSDRGGPASMGLSVRSLALGADARVLERLGAADRRAILLRAEDGDASKLLAALRAAGALLTP